MKNHLVKKNRIRNPPESLFYFSEVGTVDKELNVVLYLYHLQQCLPFLNLIHSKSFQLLRYSTGTGTRSLLAIVFFLPLVVVIAILQYRTVPYRYLPIIYIGTFRYL